MRKNTKIRKSRFRFQLEVLEDRTTPTAWFVDQVTAGAVQAGTLLQPYLTIQQAANAAQAGDTVYVRAGTYRETVTVPNNGTAANPIVFTNYNSEPVIVSGADPISGWTAAGNNVYRAAMPWNYDGTDNQSNQIFAGGHMLNLARWPTETTGDLVRNPYEATADDVIVDPGNPAQLIITDQEFTRENPARWVGAKIWFNLSYNGLDGQGQTGTVVATSGNTITVSGIDTRLGTQAWGKGPGSKYYLFQPTVSALNATGGIAAGVDPGEWFYDASAQQLYVRLPDDSAPTTTPGDANFIEAKRRTNAWVTDNRSYVTIRGFQVFSATVTTDLQANNRWGNAVNHNSGPNGVAPANHIVLDGLDVQYVTNFTDQTGNFQMQWQQQSGVILSGSDNQLINSTIHDGSGSGLSVIGQRAKVLNNVFRDLNSSVSEAGVVNFGRAYAPGLAVSEDHEFGFNTVFNSPQQGLNIRALKSSSNDPANPLARIHHNVIHDVMLRSYDSAAIDTFGLDGQFTRIDHNEIFNISGGIGVGIYLDFAKKFVIDHNLIYNVRNPILLNWTDAANPQNAYVYNNTAVSSTGDYATQNGIGNGFSNLNLGNVIANNISTKGILGGGAQTANVAYDPALFVDPALGDYRLAASAAATIDQGVTPGPAYPGMVADPVGGAAPDIGAKEFGAASPPQAPGSALISDRANPTNLALSRPTKDAVNLTWTDNASNESHYEVWRSNDAGNNWRLTAVLSANTTAFADLGIAGAAYQYKVRADWSGFSNTVNTAFRGAGQDFRPADYSAWGWDTGFPAMNTFGNGYLGNTTPNSWFRFDNIDFGVAGSITQAYARFTTYTVGSQITFRLDNPSAVPFATIATVANDPVTNEQQQTVNFSSPVSGVHTVYVYFSHWGTANMYRFGFRPLEPITITPPAAPTNLTVTPVAVVQPSLNWTPTPGAAAVIVERSADWTRFERLATVPNSVSTYTDTTAVPGATYYYRIRNVQDGLQGLATKDVKIVVPKEVTASTSVQKPAVMLDRRAQLYQQAVILTNTSPTAVAGGLRIRLQGLSPTVTLADAKIQFGSGAAAVFLPLDLSNPANPVALIPRSLLASWAPNQALQVILRFNNPGRAMINYTVRTFSDASLI